MTSAKVIADSLAPNGERLVTMEVEFHRFVLSEVNTHRQLSRNYQSSRAIPTLKMIEQVRENPAMPVHWGKNQKGMQADTELEDKEHFELRWKVAAKKAADEAEYLLEQGLHKQLVNRLLEPFMWTKGVITATIDHWEDFFFLRCHKAAQPEIQALANKIVDAINASKPQQLSWGDWHIPYVTQDRCSKTGKQLFFSSEFKEGRGLGIPTSLAIKIGVSCCAQVSYRKNDTSEEKAERIYDMLNLPVKGKYPSDPPHFSPCEHVAKIEDNAWNSELFTPSDVGGNFQTYTFYQYRKILEQGVEDIFINE